MKNLKNIDDVVKLAMFKQYVKVRQQIDKLLVAYLEGTNYRSILEGLTNNCNKIDLIIIELSEYQKEFLNSPEDDDPAKYYIDNIFTILNK